MSKVDHKQYFKAKEEIVRIQVARFNESYSVYFQKNETVPMMEFFFNKIYNIEGKELWLNLALGTFDKIKGMLSEPVRNRIEVLIELNNLTEELDKKMALLLVEGNWDGKQISIEKYIELFKKLGHKAQRLRQLEVVLENLQTFFDLAKKPMNSYIIKSVKMMATMLGVSILFKSVEEAYYAILPVSPEVFQSFYKEVQVKEKEFIENLLT